MSKKGFAAKILCLSLSLLITAAALPTKGTSASPVEAYASVYDSSPLRAVHYASEQIELQKALDNAGDGDLIQLTASFQLTSPLEVRYGITSNRTITIMSNVEFPRPVQRTITAAAGQRHLVIGNNHNTDLIFKNIVFEGSNRGGGIQIGQRLAAPNVTLSNVQIQNCVSLEESEDDATGAGGGIQLYNGQLVIEGSDTLITRNVAKKGGGIQVFLDKFGSDTKLTLKAGTISQNEATYGGGIHADAEVVIAGGTIEENTATSSGGGIYGGADSILNMTGGEILENESKGDGGGISGVSGPDRVELRGGEIRGNISASRGGGISMTRTAGNGSALILSGATISDNHAVSHGGGVFMQSIRTVDVQNTSISNNTAGSQGGGMMIIRSEEGEITNSTVTGNQARWGGGIHSNNCIISIGNSIVSSNTASSNGGGIFLSGSFLRVNRQGDSTSTFIVEDEGNLERTGYIFTGWNSSPYGNGDWYPVGSTMPITENITLYAQWEARSWTVTVTHVDMNSDPITDLPEFVSVGNGADFKVVPKAFDGYKAAHYTIGGKNDPFDFNTKTKIKENLIIMVYYTSTTIKVTFPTMREMKFYVDETTYPNVVSGAIGSSNAYYTVTNNSDCPVKIFFNGMKVNEPAGLNFVPDASDSPPGSNDIHLNLELPDPELLGDQSNGFTGEIFKIDETQTYKKLLGQLDGVHSHQAGLTSRNGYSTFGGRYAGYLTGTKKQPQLTLTFEVELIMD